MEQKKLIPSLTKYTFIQQINKWWNCYNSVIFFLDILHCFVFQVVLHFTLSDINLADVWTLYD